MFKIEVENLSWINGAADDKHDLCLHGDARATIGERTLERHATVSATALYLLKTLKKDKLFTDEIQMLPCCGHFIMANEDLTEVEIVGCNAGIDWEVTHDAHGDIVLTLRSGYSVTVDFEEYKAEVIRFADKIKAFYDTCTPKESDIEFNQKGYTAFWNEWNRRYNEATK